VQTWEKSTRLELFYSKYKEDCFKKENNLSTSYISFVDEFLNKNNRFPDDELFEKFRNHMNYIKNVYDSIIPYPKNTNFTSYVFPFLSDETIKKLLGEKYGRFLLRVSGSLVNQIVISIKNDTSVETHYLEGDSFSTLHKLCEMCTPMGMCDPKTVEWFKGQDVKMDNRAYQSLDGLNKFLSQLSLTGSNLRLIDSLMN